jgi:hypothetical protein
MDFLPYVYPLIIGLLAGVVAAQALIARRKNAKVRVLRSLVHGVNVLAHVDGKEDPIAVAKRRAEEAALLEQFKAAVAALQ